MKNLSRLLQGDRTIWIVFFTLCAISLVEVFSALSSLTYDTGSYIGPLLKHAAFLFVGFLVVVLVHNIPCRWFKILPPFGILLSVSTLFMLLMGWGVKMNGASRWLDILGFSFQPSEIAKGTLVVTTALLLSAYQTEEGADRQAMRYILGCSAVICGLIFPENFSTAVLLFGVIFLMMFIGRVPLQQLGKLLGVIAIVGAVGFGFLMSVSHDNALWIGSHIPGCGRVPTWKNRLENKLGDHNQKVLSPEDFDIDKYAQVGHANIAIASSNVRGKGPGNSVERDFLPQPYSDFIYAIIIEELGIAGAILVIFLYIVLLFRSGRIASRCEKCFPAFLVMGLALLLTCQAVLNMMVAVGLFPVTGQPLPLISRGGSSTLINCAYIGMILSVSRYAKKKESQREGTRVGDEAPGVTNEYYSEKGMV